MLTKREIVTLLTSFPRYFYLPTDAHFYIDCILRWVFALYYIPVLALIVAVTNSIGLNILFSLVIPTLQADDGVVMSDFVSPARLSGHLVFLTAKLVPFATLGMCVVTLSHKAINVVVEAMVDAFSTYCGKDYPLLAAMVEFNMESTWRRIVYMSTIVVCAAMMATSFFTEVLIAWSVREKRVKLATFYIIAVQFAYICVSVIVKLLQEDEVERKVVAREEIVRWFVSVWWKSSIHRIRFFALQMLLVFAAQWLLTSGPLDAMSFTVETLIYLNTPHLFGFTVNHLSVSLIRMAQSLRWALRHREHRASLLILAAPYQLLLMYSMMCFEFYGPMVLLMTWASAHLWARVIDVVRKHHVGHSGAVQWYFPATGEEVPINFAIVLEDAAEKGKDIPAVVTMDFRVSLANMTMTTADGNTRVIARRRRHPPQSPKFADGMCMKEVRVGVQQIDRQARIPWKDLLLHYCPQIAVLQSAASFSGKRFNGARIVARVFTGSWLLCFLMLASALVIQTSFEPLRPLQVTADFDEERNTLNVDHTPVRLFVQGNNSRVDCGYGDEKLQSTFGIEQRLCGATFSGVSSFELGWFSILPYVDHQSMREMIRFMNKNMGGDWELRLVDDKECARGRHRHSHSFTHEWAGFAEIRSRRHNVVLLAIRGTDLTSSVDMVQDLSLFFEAVFFQFLTNFVPGTSVLPSELVTDFIKMSSLAEHFGGSLAWQSLRISRPVMSERHYHHTLLRYVRTLSKELVSSNTPLILTGHSMGGSLAQIVGAISGNRAVAFSAPGIVLSRKKFGLSLKQIHQSAVNVIGSHDIVPYLGWQGGELHHLECQAATRETCHAVESVVHALWNACPSVQKKFCGIYSIDL